MTQRELAILIDTAVGCWHDVADDHGIPSCNCFREAFATKLMDEGIFKGYRQFTEEEIAEFRIERTEGGALKCT